MNKTNDDLIYKVAWNQKLHIYEERKDSSGLLHKVLVGFAEETEIRITNGGFLTFAQAKDFATHLEESRRDYAGWYEIIQVKL